MESSLASTLEPISGEVTERGEYCCTAVAAVVLHVEDLQMYLCKFYLQRTSLVMLAFIFGLSLGTCFVHLCAQFGVGWFLCHFVAGG